MRQGKDVVAYPAAIGVMDGRGEVGLVIEEAVDDVGRFARRRDRLRVERRVPGRDVGVEQGRWLVAVPGVVSTQGFPATCSQERLAVRAGYVGDPEQCGERVALLGIDQNSQGLAVGVLAQVPAGGPGQ